MDKINFIGGEASEEQITTAANKIIDSLESFNLADKVLIIGNLYRSLIETIKENGGTVIETEDLSK